MQKKLLLSLLVLILIALSVFGYLRFKKNKPAPLEPVASFQSFGNDSPSSIDSTDDLTNDNDKDNSQLTTNNINATDNENTLGEKNNLNKKVLVVSPVPKVSGSKLANITQEHCSNDCQAFGIDLTLKEYCEQACGISPIKNVSSCDDQKDIQKDYCQKDLAITKKDSSLCDKIIDGNIKLACQSRIQQDAIENDQLNSSQKSAPTQ